MRDTSKLCGTQVAYVCLRDCGLISTVRPHPGNVSCLGELDHLAVHLDELCWCSGCGTSRRRAVRHGELAVVTRVLPRDSKGEVMVMAESKRRP